MLYTNAAYAEALRTLGDATAPEAQHYRALCLLALGRTADAQQALDALVTSTPGYVVIAEDMPPRFVAMLSQAKQKTLPTVLRRLLASGREQFQSNAFESARKDFDLLLTLAADPMIGELSEVADLRLLASGFIDLMASKTRPPAAEPASEPPPAPAPTVVQQQPTAVVTPAVAISQRIPSWPINAAPPGPAVAANAVGLVRLRIGADGRVKSATLERGVHPAYNVTLLAEARKWIYKPATINGVPTESETVVSFRVTP